MNHHTGKGGVMSEESGKKQRLLIVDDSKVIRVTARKILQDHFETVEAIHGENAWEILSNEEPFSLIVSDLTMPELDGYGLLERIRSSHAPRIQNIPVIVITGSNDSDIVKERASSAGATDFIGKPFDSIDLLARTQALADAYTTTTILTEENIALEDQLTTDSLTGLANESAFMDQGYQQLSYAVRHKSSMAVFRIEIDDFGDLFKQHGESASESMVKAVATVLQSAIRHEDLAARTGTARFSLLLTDMDKTGTRNLADRINRDISARILKQGDTKINFTVSIGVAAPDIVRDTRFEELLSVADSRLVYATSSGGNQVIHECVEKQPPLPQNSPEITETAEPAPPVPEEVAASIPEPVETAVEAEPELMLEDMVASEIEELTLSDDQLPAVECRSTADTDSQPAKFSGPVSEPATDHSSDSATYTSNTPASTPASEPVSEQVSEQVSDPVNEPVNDPVNEPVNEPVDIPASIPETAGDTTTANHFPGEMIVVGVPSSDFLPYEHKTKSVQPPAATDETDSVNSTDMQTAADAHTLTGDESGAGKRPGFFRRLLSGIGSIFRRS
jgi:two-component system cell cycle response regulator